MKIHGPEFGCEMCIHSLKWSSLLNLENNLTIDVKQGDQPFPVNMLSTDGLFIDGSHC